MNNFLLGAYAIGLGCIFAPIACLVIYGLLQGERKKLPLAIDLECIEVRIQHKKRELEEAEEKYREQEGRKNQFEEDALRLEEQIRQSQSKLDQLETELNGLSGKREDIAHWHEEHLETQEKLNKLLGEFNSLKEEKKQLDEQMWIREQGLKILADEERRMREALEKLEKEEKALQVRCAKLQPLVEQCWKEEERMKTIRAEVDELRKKWQDLKDGIGESNLHAELAQKRLESEKRKLEALAGEGLRERAALDGTREELKQLQEKCAAMRAKEAEYAAKEEVWRQEEGKMERLRADWQKVSREVEELTLKRDSLCGVVEARQKQAEEDGKAHDGLLDELKQLQEKCAAMRAKEAEYAAKEEVWRQEEGKMERLRADWQKVSREVEELTLKRDSLCGVVEVRQKQAEEDGKAHDGLLTVPNCLKRDWKGRSSLGPDDEGDALEQLRKYLESRNFFFSGRRLYSFHTALKSARTSPLTILAGVSGTGKSLLAKNYADALGMHFLSLAVQPRWDGPQDLFGFYNYLEKRYVPTELAQAMVHMDFFNAERNGIPDSAKKFRDRILLVLLDEMNLARVEYYFSDFLSKLEVRREIENPEKFEQRQAAEVLLGEGVQGDGKRLFPGKNVLFVGTMNEDDSTQTPSPKVVDRSNVLSFERPENFRETQEQWHPMAMPENYLSFETWKSWCHGSKELPGGALEKIRSGLQEINNALAGIGRPFAHRVYNAIVEYIANYPGALEHGDAGRQRRGWAFSDQVEMRLLPKLRGVELSDCAVEVALDVVRSVLEEGTWKDDALLQSFDAASDKNRQGQFIWQGVHRDE